MRNDDYTRCDRLYVYVLGLNSSLTMAVSPVSMARVMMDVHMAVTMSPAPVLYHRHRECIRRGHGAQRTIRIMRRHKSRGGGRHGICIVGWEGWVWIRVRM